VQITLVRNVQDERAQRELSRIHHWTNRFRLRLLSDQDMQPDQLLDSFANVLGRTSWLERLTQLFEGQAGLLLYAFENCFCHAIQHKQRHTLGRNQDLLLTGGNQMGVFGTDVEVHEKGEEAKR
jgi:hypothetical protein